MPATPFAVGDEVLVIRARHGWHDGELRARVISRHQRATGTWSYVVRDQAGQDHEVAHTRDLRAGAPVRGC